mmetsp:Transcript_22389/g.37446  ORF Transcript_22389/g.37446 Transcript_22389/m.37446 type:complete len:372 (-) Transcript_22389:227-1342(-)
MESFRQINWTDVLSNRPLFTGCSSALIILYCCNFLLRECTDTIGLVAANTMITNTYVWNLLTSCFYEQYVAKVVVDITCLLFVSKSLPIPNIEQFGLYFIFSVLACTIGTSVYCFVAFFTMGKEEMLITPIFGFSGVLMSILMFARHTFRNESVHPAFPKLTYHHLPVVLMVIQIVLRLVPFDYLVADFPFTATAMFFCWGYLRFYYKFDTTSGAEFGDRADDFTFVSMFPEALHIVLVPFTTAFYNLCALTGLFPPLEPVERKMSYHHLRSITNSSSGTSSSSISGSSNGGNAAGSDGDGNSSSGAAGTGGVPAKTDIIAERRRAKALKLLDAKMAELSQEPEGWDDVGAMQDVESVLMPTPAELNKFKV